MQGVIFQFVFHWSIRFQLPNSLTSIDKLSGTGTEPLVKISLLIPEYFSRLIVNFLNIWKVLDKLQIESFHEKWPSRIMEHLMIWNTFKFESHLKSKRPLQQMTWSHPLPVTPELSSTLQLSQVCMIQSIIKPKTKSVKVSMNDIQLLKGTDLSPWSLEVHFD